MKGRTHAECIAPPAYLATRGTKWRDPRTAVILAHGATQNWPTPADHTYMKKEQAKLTEAKRREATDKRASAMINVINPD